MSWTFLLKVWPLFRCSRMAAFGCSLRPKALLLLDGASEIGAIPLPVSSAGYKCRYSCPTGSGYPSQPFTFLRPVVLAANQLKVIGQTSQQIECSHHGSVLLPQDDLIPSPKDLDFLAFQSKLLRQSDRLTISRTKYPSSAHEPTSLIVYT